MQAKLLILKTFLCLIVFTHFLLSQYASAETLSNNTIKIRAEHWQTYSEQGDGYLFQLLTHIFKPLGYDLEFKFCPWRRCIQEVLNKEADIIVAVYDNELFLGEHMQVNELPVFIEKVGVAFKRDKWPDWQGQESIRNQETAALRGYDFHLELNVPLKLVEVSSYDQEWKLLIANRVDFILDGIYALEQYREKYAQNPDDYRLELLFTKYSYMGFGTSERTLRLRQVFDQGLKQLYDSGKIYQLQKQWAIPEIPPQNAIFKH